MALMTHVYCSTLSCFVLFWYTNLIKYAADKWNNLNGILRYEVSTLALVFQGAGGGMRNFVPPNRS